LGKCCPEAHLGHFRPALDNQILWLVAEDLPAWNVGWCLSPGGNGCGLSAMAGVPSVKARAHTADAKR
jgi:hypothetical protein